MINYTTADQSCCGRFGKFIVCTGVGKPKMRGGDRMAGKTSKAAPKKPKGRIGKSVKKK